MNKDSLIGRGRTAEVYLWEDNKVIKLYHEWYSREQVKLEADISRAVHEAGIPSPRVYGMVNEENRQGRSTTFSSFQGCCAPGFRDNRS